MQRSAVIIVLAAALVAAAAPASAGAAEPSAFERILGHYEAIRQSLLRDSTEGVATAAGHIEREVGALESDFSVKAAGILDGSEEDLREILASIRNATSQSQGADSLAKARDAFGTLSKAMVRYRRLVPDPVPVVVFCAMAEAVWLQPNGEIGNPYYGQSMARCGEVVSD